MKPLKESIMNNFKDNLCAYADYLEENNCEFIILAYNKDTDNAEVLMSENSTEMLSAIFDKSPIVHETFKDAEQMMESYDFGMSLN